MVNYKGKSYLLVGNKYRPSVKKTLLEFPGGKVFDNESILDAGLRAIEEWFGFEIDKEDFILRLECFSDPWKTNEVYGVLKIEINLEKGENLKIFESRHSKLKNNKFSALDIDPEGLIERVRELEKKEDSVVSFQVDKFICGRVMKNLVLDF